MLVLVQALRAALKAWAMTTATAFAKAGGLATGPGSLAISVDIVEQSAARGGAGLSDAALRERRQVASLHGGSLQLLVRLHSRNSDEGTVDVEAREAGAAPPRLTRSILVRVPPKPGAPAAATLSSFSLATSGGMWTNKQGTRVLARSEFTLAELVALGLVGHPL